MRLYAYLQAIEKGKEIQVSTLQELQNEVRSLKALVLNRRTTNFSMPNTSQATSSSSCSPSTAPQNNTSEENAENGGIVSADASSILPSKSHIPAWQLQAVSDETSA